VVPTTLSAPLKAEGRTALPTGYTASLADEYQLLFDSCLIRPARLAAAGQLATQIAANRARYQTVGGPLGIPWYAVGLIHAMEASLNFDCQLHNGDPLTARTVHVPAGRPSTGSPPFTWEESATDALTFQGLNTVTDWMTPGLLYQLEKYNGFGYRTVPKPPIPTPYLWSFSNHYAAGKFVADGTYSPAAVSQQCGAAVVLKRMVQTGSVQLPGFRTLQLANPDMVGPDVEAAQTLLTTNAFGNFQPGTADGDFGQVTSDAVKRAKLALGFPQAQVNGTYGSVLDAYLRGENPLPPAYQATRQQRLAASSGEDAIRAQIVQWATWGVTNNARIAYSTGPTRFSALGTPGSLPLATDCSAFATLCYAWAGAPNPNSPGKYDAAAGGFTGTLLAHCRHVPLAGTKPGDLVVWTSPAKPNGSHAAIVVATGANPMLVSHGGDAGPVKIRFSDEDAIQRQLNGGTATAVFLSAF
jgi:lysozyme family protein